VLNGIGITSSKDQTLINGILSIYNFIIAITAAMSVEKAGRRPLFVISTGGMVISYAIITAMSATYEKTANASAGRALLAFVFLFNGFYAIAYTPLLVSYTVEILPFFIRAKGLAVMTFSVQGAIIFNQYTNPIALDAIKWKYYLIYTIWLVFEFVCIWLWAFETKGRTLEETAALFDGEEVVAELTNRTGQDLAEGGVRRDGKTSTIESNGDEKPEITHTEPA
jgi:MFS family permease